MNIFDLNLLKEARKNIATVYEFNYGSTDFKKEVKRLETILNKLGEVIRMFESK